MGLQVGPELDNFGKHDDYDSGFIKGLVDISPSGTPVTGTSTCEYGNKFEMRCPGELVDRHDPERAKAPGNEQRCVAGESGRIARYRDDPLHRRMREYRRLCSGSGARRIEHGGLKQQPARLSLVAIGRLYCRF